MKRNEKGQFASERELSGEYKELYDDYSGWITATSQKQTTTDRLKHGVKAWLYWCSEEDIDPMTVDKRTVNAYIRMMITDEYADTTISRRFASVSKYYHFLINDPSIEFDLDNPTADISLPKDHNIKNVSDSIMSRGTTEILNYDPRNSIEETTRIFTIDTSGGSRTSIT